MCCHSGGGIRFARLPSVIEILPLFGVLLARCNYSKNRV